MKKIAKQLTDLVGNTPLMELSNYNKSKGPVSYTHLTLPTIA